MAAQFDQEPVFSPDLPEFEFDPQRRIVYYVMPNGRREARTLDDFRVVTRMANELLAEIDARGGAVLPPEVQTKLRH